MSPLPDFSTRDQPGAFGSGSWLLATGLIVLGLASVEAWQATGARRSAEAELALARQESARLRVRSAELSGSARQQSLSSQLTAFEATPARLASDLARSLPRDVRLSSLELSYGFEPQLKLGVEARDARAFDRFVEALSASDRFGDLRFSSERRKPGLRSGLQATWTFEGGR